MVSIIGSTRELLLSPRGSNDGTNLIVAIPDSTHTGRALEESLEGLMAYNEAHEAARDAIKRRKKMWMGSTPSHCDLCRQPLAQQFVDGKTQFGPWAIMCAICHRDQAIGLGLGRGQRYDLKTLEKIDG